MLISKKAQSEIIVIVLIILLVLAVIGIVSMVVTKTVKRGAETAEQKSDCLAVKLTIAEALADASTISVERATGMGNITALKISVNGVISEEATQIPSELETKTITLSTPLVSGDEVKIAPVLAGDILCDFADSVTVI